MIYAWLSISKGCLNYANGLIEQETDKLLHLHGERKTYSIFEYLSDRDIEYINDFCSFVIIPGCTTLHDSTKGVDLSPQEIINDPRRGYKATTRLKDIRVPIYDIGGAFGSNEPTLNVAKYIHQPIGVRDPFTDDILKKNGIKSILVGCPTLFVGNATDWGYSNNGPIVFNFGAGSIDEQVKVLELLNNIYPNILIVLQEKDQIDIVKKYHLANKLVAYSNVSKILSLYKNAKCVITGRLHAVLPSIALGTPVIFIRTHESRRFSLLEHLTLPINDVKDIMGILRYLDDIEINIFQDHLLFIKIRHLKKKYLEYIEYINRETSKHTGINPVRKNRRFGPVKRLN